jgi:hypothetical protein
VSGVRDCLFNIFAANLHIGGRSSIRNLMMRHAVVQEPTYHMGAYGTPYTNSQDSETRVLRDYPTRLGVMGEYVQCSRSVVLVRFSTLTILPHVYGPLTNPFTCERKRFVCLFGRYTEKSTEQYSQHSVHVTR